MTVIALVGSRVGSRRESASGAAGNRRRLVVVPAVLAALLLVTGGLNSDEHRDRVLAAYPKADPLVGPEEYALFSRIDEHVAPDEIVAQMPLNGSPLVMALSRRQVLFPQINTGRTTADQLYLAQHLVDARSDPKVCEIVNRLDVRYMLTNDTRRGTVWDGLTYPGQSEIAGFELVDQGGTFDLYRVTACDRPHNEPGA
jgi:hypothetical protein